VHQFFLDDRIDEAERAELQSLLTALVGGHEALLLGYEASTQLPLDVPPPLV
jgi:hypothetical protein